MSTFPKKLANLARLISVFAIIGSAIAAPFMVQAPALVTTAAAQGKGGDFGPDVCNGNSAQAFGPENPLPGNNPCGPQDELVRVTDPWRAGCNGDVINDSADCSSIKQWMPYSAVAGFLAKLGYDRGSIWYPPKNGSSNGGNTGGTQPGNSGGTNGGSTGSGSNVGTQSGSWRRRAVRMRCRPVMVGALMSPSSVGFEITALTIV